jgi:hypothetical protein
LDQSPKILQLKARIISGKLKDGLVEIEVPETKGRFATSVDTKITVNGKPLPYVTKIVLIIDAEKAKNVPTLTISKMVLQE